MKELPCVPPEPLLHQEGRSCSGLWYWECDPVEHRREVRNSCQEREYSKYVKIHRLVWYADNAACSFRGRVIPSDLEAKIIDAKQKVSVPVSYSVSLFTYLFSLFNQTFHLWTVVRVILQGCVPLFVNATAGSTVYGAFDPINEIADICEKYNLWLHVDVSIRSSCCSMLTVAIVT